MSRALAAAREKAQAQLPGCRKQGSRSQSKLPSLAPWLQGERRFDIWLPGWAGQWGWGAPMLVARLGSKLQRGGINQAGCALHALPALHLFGSEEFHCNTRAICHRL